MRSRLFLFLTAILLLACHAAWSLPATGSPPKPAAKNGVLDLRGYDLGRQPALSLRGEWLIYHQQLLEPADFKQITPPKPDDVVILPGYWKGAKRRGETEEGTGFATLRLTVLPKATPETMALQLSGITSAYRLWVNGELVKESGRIGQNAQEEVLNAQMNSVLLHLSNQPVEILIQASNYHQRRGMFQSIQLGRVAELERSRIQRWGLALAVVGTLGLFGFYHLALYGWRRQERAPLYLAFYCLLWLGYVLCAPASDWVIRVFVPDIPGELVYRINMFCYFLAVPMSYQFFRALYSQEFPRWLLWLLWGLSGPAALLPIFGSTMMISDVFPVFHIISGFKVLIALACLGLAVKRKRDGAWLILAGYFVLGTIALNDILHDLDIIRSVLLLHVGMLALMFFQALALAQRFSHLFSTVEHLSTELGQNNQALLNEIDERIRLQKEVLSVGMDERRQISHQLHDGLCQQLTAARLYCSALAETVPAHDHKAQQAAFGKLGTILDQSVGQTYDISRGLWPIDIDTDDACAALTSLVQQQSAASGIPIQFIAENMCPACATPQTIHLCSIAREAMVNALKHGKPSYIAVRLSCSAGRQLTLTISDDGIGMQTPSSSKGGELGTRMMKYRAQALGGAFRLETNESGGVSAVCQIPCQPNQV